MSAAAPTLPFAHRWQSGVAVAAALTTAIGIWVFLWKRRFDRKVVFDVAPNPSPLDVSSEARRSPGFCGVDL